MVKEKHEGGGGIPSPGKIGLKDKVKKLQNRAARVVTKTKYDSIEPDVFLRNLGWLNVQQLIDLDTASMVHKAINNVGHLLTCQSFSTRQKQSIIMTPEGPRMDFFLNIQT